jgi:Mrp family chromosome partitioning ATPase
MNERRRAQSAGSADRVRFREEEGVAPARPVAVLDSLRDPRSPVGEEFRLLRAKVQTLRHQRTMKCLALVSALPGEGKSTVALGLAAALAREPGRRILLIEGDLRRPSISRELGLAPFPGLGEWLNGDIDDVPVRPVAPGGFFLLSAGQSELERPEELGSTRMKSLLGTARDGFDHVVLDATPILPVADVILLQDLVDGLLFVVRSRQTPRAAILDALKRVRADKVVGIVLNDHREYRESYMAYAYHGYGMRDGSRSSDSSEDDRSSRRSRQP